MRRRIVSALSVLTMILSLTVPGKQASSAAESSSDDRYSMSFALDGNKVDISLTLLNDSGAVLTATDSFTCGYERTGNAVSLI